MNVFPHRGVFLVAATTRRWFVAVVLIVSGLLSLATSKRSLKAEGVVLDTSLALKTFLVLFAVVALIDSRSFWRQVGDARPDPDPSRPLDHATRSDRLLVGLLGFGIIVIPTLGSGAWMGPQILLMLFLHGQAVISLGCLALATGTAMLINTLLLERWERRHGK